MKFYQSVRMYTRGAGTNGKPLALFVEAITIYT